jgi:hypothetical protein
MKIIIKECKFYGYISTLSTPSEFSSRYEAEAYESAVEKFKTFNSVLAIVEKLDDFTSEI